MPFCKNSSSSNIARSLMTDLSLGLSWLWFILSLLCVPELIESQNYIERFKYPTTDNFRSPSSSTSSICFWSKYCSNLNARCTNFRCCTCNCDSNRPTFFSINNGCLTSQSIEDHLLNQYGNYWISPEKRDWHSALIRCKEFGGNLASINSNQKNAVIKALITAVNDDFWIGLNDIKSEGHFAWSDKSVFNYTDWADEEPNNSGDCGHIWKKYQKWDDTSCESLKRYICRVPDCKTTIKGTEYRGTISTTISGRNCQAWTSHTPHSHKPLSRWPNTGLEKNYCRNPDKESDGPWCYTMDKNKRWEYCSVNLCTGKKCRFSIKGTDNKYIATLSHWNDLINHEVEVKLDQQDRKQQIKVDRDDVTCVTSHIVYFSREGNERLLFENKCSEIFGLRIQHLPSDADKIILMWNASESDTSWSLLKGKLLKMNINCTVKSTKVSIASCLLFKVTGSYDDKLTPPPVKSPITCSVAPTRSPTTISSATKANATTSRATTPTTASKGSNQTSVTDPPSARKFVGYKIGIIIGTTIAILILFGAIIALLLFRRHKSRRNEDNIYLEPQPCRESVPLSDLGLPRYEKAFASAPAPNAEQPEDHLYEGLMDHSQPSEYAKPVKIYDYAYTELDKPTIKKDDNPPEYQTTNGLEQVNPYYKAAEEKPLYEDEQPLYEDMTLGRQQASQYKKPAPNNKTDEVGAYVEPSGQYVDPAEINI